MPQLIIWEQMNDSRWSSFRLMVVQRVARINTFSTMLARLAFKRLCFRMSCIYGPYQLGSEDQGWVAHFLRQALKGEPITIYGDGKQVRDLLFVEDLVSTLCSVFSKTCQWPRAKRLTLEEVRRIAQALSS